MGGGGVLDRPKWRPRLDQGMLGRKAPFKAHGVSIQSLESRHWCRPSWPHFVFEATTTQTGVQTYRIKLMTKQNCYLPRTSTYPEST